jgi:diguanylate cyclase (GGDEF)-like protein/PAS domain S-box-containing protein
VIKRLPGFASLCKAAPGLLLGGLCALLIAGAGQRGWLAAAERSGLDTLFQIRGPVYPSPEIAVVVADDASVARAGGWPLPRRLYADAIHRLHRAGARTIAFDIVFSKKSYSSQDDAALADACRDAGSVVSAAVFQLPSRKGATTPVDLPGDTIAPLPRFGIAGRQLPSLDANGAMGPRLALQQSSAAIGHINAEPDRDGILRRVSHLIRFRGVAYPSLALAATAEFLGLRPQAIEVRDGVLVLPGRHLLYRVPVDSEARVLVNWIGGTRSFPTYNFEQLRSGEIPSAALKNRIVLIGVTATAAFDHHSSPFSPAQPAVEVQANAINDILSQRVLRPIPLWVQWGVLFALAMLAGGFMVSRSAWKSVLSALALMLLVWSAGLVLLGMNWYFPVAAPLIAVLLTLGVAISYRQIADARDLKQAKERYDLAVRGANDGLWDWELATGKIYFSPRWKEIIGCSGDGDHAVGKAPDDWFGRVFEDDIEQLRADVQTHLAGHSPHLENEHRLRHRDGSYRWVLCRGIATRGARGKATRVAGSLSDITERKQNEEQLRFDALHDKLTRLANRTLLMNLLEHAIEQKGRHAEHNFALLFLDVDRFKFVNDSFGHLAGDELLVMIAERLKNCLRSGCTPARLGGDEFAVLYESYADQLEINRVAERVQDEMCLPFHLNGQEIFVTFSIGIVHDFSGYSKPDEILRDGEIAMYRAKSGGRFRYEIFDVNMHRQIVSRVKLESDLRRALDRREFLLHYQPIVSLFDGTIAGFESLIRWQTAGGQLFPPEKFIPLAEETGLIAEMDLWSLEHACGQLRKWQAMQTDSGAEYSSLFVSVNLSRKLFTLPDLVPRVREILQKTEFDPSCLKLEITESAIVENTEAAIAMLKDLKSLGLQLSIDDFGIGYSSLSYLHQFPLDVLKIDRSFIDGMETDEGKLKIVWTIIAMAHNLGLQIVAEGAETEEQQQHLQSLTCDYGQGFYFSKPLTAQEAEALLQSSRRWPSVSNKNLVSLPSARHAIVQ